MPHELLPVELHVLIFRIPLPRQSQKKLTLMEIYFQPPITVWKTQRISFMFWECSRLCSKKSMVSIAYCRMEIPPSTRCGTTPLSWSSIFARLMNSASISATRLNRMGGRGSPCRSPFFVEKIGLPHHSYWLLRSCLRWRIWSTQSILMKTLSTEAFVLRSPIEPCRRLFQSLFWR